MAMSDRVIEIIVPATTANLGPGFDSLGLALRLYNYLRVQPAESLTIELTGHGQAELPRDESNLMLRAARRLAEAAGRQLPPLHWQAHHDIPLARGLGSSSAAIVAGLLCANEVLGLGLGVDDLVELAAEIEGHPDNVAPALLGGLTVCLPESRPLRVLNLRPHAQLRVVLCIPRLQISTAEARRVLPQAVEFRDAVFNLSRAAGMVASLAEGIWDALAECSRDRLHQPYRLRLMPGAEEIMEAAVGAGAHGAVVSGSGPTIAAFVSGGAGRVARAMADEAARRGWQAAVCVVRPDTRGARVQCRPAI